jgi:hypothetical protein
MALSRRVTALLVTWLNWTVWAAESPPQAKKPKMTILFEVPFGESPGQFYFEPSPLGSVLDAYPREFALDSAGNFLFLEPTPAARLTKYTGAGKFAWAFPLADRLPESITASEISPHQLFVTKNGAAVLMSAKGAGGLLLRAYLAYFDAAGSFTRLVPLQGFDPKYFEEGGVSEIDGAGYLLAMRPAGTTEVYAPDGTRSQTINEQASYVDPAGLLFTVTQPIEILKREGGTRKELFVVGAESPKSIEGGNGHGLVWTVRQGEKETKNGRLSYRWSLDLFSFLPSGPSVTFLKTIDLPASEFLALDPGEAILQREKIYGPKIILDEHGFAYMMGRSEQKCWIVKIDPSL